MSPRPGGESDKFGNRYEGAWTVRHVAGIMSVRDRPQPTRPRYASFRSDASGEPEGNHEGGVELSELGWTELTAPAAEDGGGKSEQVVAVGSTFVMQTLIWTYLDLCNVPTECAREPTRR